MPSAALAPVSRRLPAPLAALLAVALTLSAAGCGEQRAPISDGATEPLQAVALLSGHLRDNDLQAFARDAVPPSLRPSLAAAWQAGRTRWPLEELPFDHRIPSALATLSADGAEARLRKTFDRQFANAHVELRAAVQALGLFGAKYLQSDQTLTAEERAHYVQLVDAMTEWGGRAQLGDPKRAHATIAKLSLAARQSGLRDEADFRRLGMERSLRELGPMAAAVKAALAGYGLDLDASLDAMRLSLESQDGDRARVRMRYPLAGRTIETVVAVERVDGYWYLSDFLRHARAAAASPPVPAAPLPPVAAPESTATTKPTSS